MHRFTFFVLFLLWSTPASAQDMASAMNCDNAPKSFTNLRDQAARYYYEAHYKSAQKLYERIGRLQPMGGSVWFNIGCCLFMRGEIDKASEMYKKALSCSPGLPECYFYVGLIDDINSKPDASCSNYEMYLKTLPVPTHTKLGIPRIDKVAGVTTAYRFQSFAKRRLQEMHTNKAGSVISRSDHQFFPVLHPIFYSSKNHSAPRKREDSDDVSRKNSFDNRVPAT